MNKEVQERIEEAIENKATRLDLTSCGLREIPKEIGEMVWLKELDLSNNQITKIEGLEELQQLQSLHLNSNQISKIKGLEQNENLKLLNVISNQISKIEGLEQNENLEILFLDSNKISNIEGIDNLINLKIFTVNENPIRKISSSFILKKIDVIDLSGTLIQDLSPIKSKILTNKKVFWSYADLSAPYTSSPNFVNLRIGTNNFCDKKGIYVNNCHQLKQPPPEWILLGPEMVKSYFQAIEEQGAEELNEVKVLLVGDGGAGKTSLAYRLTKPGEALPQQDERTRGIDVYDWTYHKNGKDYLVHLWDFGGQIMYDMVHQYFYSARSLYILLDSSRSGANENDSRLNQLLQSAELFGRCIFM